MQMANIACKKYTIQTIINPGTFYAVEHGRNIQSGVKRTVTLEHVKKFQNEKEISIGQIVAVKYENKFYRGLITDIYNRCLKPKYFIWLVDIDKNVEASFDLVFMLKTSELKNKELNSLEIVMNGIQPVTIELLVSSVTLDGDRNNVGGILHKRESNKWSPAAFKFVKDLFKTNKCIYVKCIDINGSKISGDIYYKHKDDGVLISLAQTLCDKDFAVLSNNQSGITTLDYLGNDYLYSIERRIPNTSKDVEWEELGVIHHNPAVHGSKSGSSNITSSESDKSSYSGSDKFLNNSGGKTIGSFSPSWILKKVNSISLSTSSESFESSCQHIPQAASTVSSPKVSIFRIVERNIKLYNKQKANI